MAETFVDSAADAVRGNFCSGLSLAGDFYDWAEQATTNLPGGSVLTVIPRTAISGATGLFCNREPVAPPAQPGPQFLGGQCSTQYSVEVVGSYLSGFFGGRQERTSTTLVTGPIGEVYAQQDGAVMRWFIPTPTGGVQADAVTESLGSVTEGAVESVIPTRTDGLPDDCGNLPGGNPDAQPPGTGAPVNDDIVYGPPGSEVNIPVTIGFGGPLVGVTGQLIIPFIIENPTLSLTGNLNLTTGDINFNIGGSNPDNEPCCLPPGEDDEDRPPEGGDDNEPEEAQIIGVVVNGTVDDSVIRSTKVGQTNGEDFYQPRIGNVFFKLKLKGLITFIGPITVQHTNQYIPCPVEFGAIGVRVSGVEGTSLRLTPVRSRIPVIDIF